MIAYPCLQFGWINRLAQIVLSPVFESTESGFSIGEAGNHDHWNWPGLTVILQTFDYLKAANSRHFDIKEDQIRQVLSRQIECLFAAACFQRPVTLILEKIADKFSAFGIVFYKKDDRVGISHDVEIPPSCSRTSLKVCNSFSAVYGFARNA